MGGIEASAPWQHDFGTCTGCWSTKLEGARRGAKIESRQRRWSRAGSGRLGSSLHRQGWVRSWQTFSKQFRNQQFDPQLPRISQKSSLCDARLAAGMRCKRHENR